MNFAAYLLEAGADDQIALISEKQEISYAALHQAVLQMTARLKQNGVQPGDRVVLLSANSLFWVTSYLATLYLGAVSVPLPTSIQPDELEAIVQLTDCGVICLQARSRRHMPASILQNSRFVWDNEIVSAERVSISPYPIVDSNKEAVLLLTSGTTARPKLVQLSHANLSANTNSIIAYLELSSEDRMMVAMPFYYCFGLSLLHTHLRAGGTAVLNNRFAFPEMVLDMIQETNCTGFAGVPSMYHTLLRNTTFTQRHFPALNKVQQAGGYLAPVLIRELMATLPQSDVYIMYGQTEATARLSYLPPQMLTEKVGSIGKGIPGVALQVVDKAGQWVAVGAVGEIVARGDNIALGYWQNQAETDKKFKDNALYTGDLATVDEDGFIFIVDRESDILKPNGMRVSSHKVEACLMQLAGVVQTAVIGVPDAQRGEAVRAYIVLAPDVQCDEQEIIKHCRQHMAHPVVPSQIIFVNSLPLNSNGKVLHATLRQMARQETQPTARVLVA